MSSYATGRFAMTKSKWRVMDEEWVWGSALLGVLVVSVLAFGGSSCS